MQHSVHSIWRRMGGTAWETGVRMRLAGRAKLVSLVVALCLVAGVVAVAALPGTLFASEENLLANGSFEHGFSSIDGCGEVGGQWNCFTSGGVANYGFYDDQWEPVVADGNHSQLIEINTKGLAAADADRYAGIGQTVRIVPNATYKFSMRGMIRTTHSDGDPWRYRVQVGYGVGPNAKWQDVDNWVDAGWDTYYERTKPGSMHQFQTSFRPSSEVITLFVRVWKKWGVPNEELDVNLDAIALMGPKAGYRQTPSKGIGGPVLVGPSVRPAGPGPEARPQGSMAGKPVEQSGPSISWQPEPATPVVCQGPELIYNGDFEIGFNKTGYGDVGRGWGAFTNGGAVAYGFYAEEWSPVVADGKYGQLIEISSKGFYPTDGDRYAGIFQRIDGLHPGATYELSLRGLLRGEGDEADPYRFAAQWGFAEGGNADWRHVDNWTEMDLGAIAPRTQPTYLPAYSVSFTAPARQIVLFVRGWKKWATTNVEMDFNLDAISLRGCDLPSKGMGGPQVRPGAHPQQPQPQPQQPRYPSESKQPTQPQQPSGPTVCEYVVRPGDTLSQIAQRYSASAQEIMRANRISNPDLVYIGLTLVIPDCKDGRPATGMQQPVRPGGPPQANAPQGPAMGAQPRTYTVRSGDSLSGIAVRFNVNQSALARANGIRDLDVVYIGQVLTIP
jgi:LysM repeat protein